MPFDCPTHVLCRHDAQVFGLYMALLETRQCKDVVCFVFSALQSFVNKFADLLFQGPTECCADLVEQVAGCRSLPDVLPYV